MFKTALNTIKSINPSAKKKNEQELHVSAFLDVIKLAFLTSLSIFSSTGHRPASLCHGPLSVVRASVHPCVNFFFKHLLL